MVGLTTKVIQQISTAWCEGCDAKGWWVYIVFHRLFSAVGWVSLNMKKINGDSMGLDSSCPSHNFQETHLSKVKSVCIVATSLFTIDVAFLCEILGGWPRSSIIHRRYVATINCHDTCTYIFTSILPSRTRLRLKKLMNFKAALEMTGCPPKYFLAIEGLSHVVTKSEKYGKVVIN